MSRRKMLNEIRPVRLLEQATPAFIPPVLCPPNSPDLNPVDYKIWAAATSLPVASAQHR